MRKKRFFVLFLILLLLLTGCGKNNSDPTWYPKPSNDKTTKSDTDAGTTEPDSEAGPLVLDVESFYFVESAFECGKGPDKSQVIAVIRTAVDSADIKLTAVCQETGDKIELTDDGKGTDTVAGDRIFCGEGSFSSDEEKKLAYSLHSESDQISVSAPDAFVRFYTLESCNAELDRIDRIQAELDDIAAEFSFDENQETETAAENYLKTAEKMENYLKGLVNEGIVESYEWAFPEFTIYLPIGAFVYTFGDFGNDFLGGGSETAYTLCVEYDQQ